MTVSVAIVALEGVSDSSLAVTLDAFLAANRAATALLRQPAPFDVCVVGVTRARVRARSGMEVTPARTFAGLRKVDLAIVPGMGMADPAEIDATLGQPHVRAACSWLARRWRTGAHVASSCSGVFLLAAAGLLDGQPATTTWWLGPELAARFPAVEVDAAQMVVEGDRVLTAGAALAQIDLVLRLVSRFAGPSLAELVARYLVVDERPSQARYAIVHHLTHGSDTARKAERWIRKNLDRPFRMAELARATASTHRTLARRMREATGLSPLAFVQQVRMETARHLLATTRISVEEIACRVGYDTSATLRRVLAQHTGLRPSDLRPPRQPPRPEIKKPMKAP